jgi:hypothetical protein
MTRYKQVNDLIHRKGCIAFYLFESNQSWFWCLCVRLIAVETDQQCKSPSNGIYLQCIFVNVLRVKEYFQR